MTKEERLSRAMLRATKEERRRILRAAGKLKNKRLVPGSDAMEAICDVVLAWERAQRKRERDLLSDNRTRRTLGARVPVDLYERCKRDAEGQGLSLYRWCTNAFLAALEAPPWTA